MIWRDFGTHVSEIRFRHWPIFISPDANDWIGSRIGFATVSSFMMLLIVQAPSKEHALRARRLIFMWRQALRGQSQGCELLNLALVRLDGPHWAGLARNFFLPRHVKEALECTLDQS